MSYQKAQDHLNSFINYERLNRYPYRSSFRLNRAKRLLEFLGNPHLSLRCVHIAGTKGKGSTCAFIAHILKEAGFKVGLYTSPHLLDVRERIRILKPSSISLHLSADDKIPKKDFARLIEKTKPYAEKLRKTRLGSLSYYELLTALAFLYFKSERCDFVVLETGIGGRLDATNVCQAELCALTPISYEHREVLGNTLEEIAREKVEIVKPATRAVITAPQRPTVLRIIKRQTRRTGARLLQVGKEIRIRNESLASRSQSFDLTGVFGDYSGLKMHLLGMHQITNAAVALGCIGYFKRQGVNISTKAIKEGLKKTLWPGRLDIISHWPKIVLDGAQNQASAHALKKSLKSFFKFKNLILVLGVSQDKDVRGISKELVPISDRIILTKSENPRAMHPEIIKKFISASKGPVCLTDNTKEALEMAVECVDGNDLVLVTGSLFLVAEVLKLKNEESF
ncbi:MAG: bifunctional folylpolyglutamate synthase/dihydrofolate synthase [Candidatus Omnitrophica bacterium]|nr:bifunctional folylpolyglutamate synthase/dihydrofolate synthase [Candidatus Omnitrophota bacterium]